jgi:UDP-N-acetylglucosamine diphosphorylase / glucose-1-phosphate thymidylyltransferase / UDP-N-acetylgalactosamine diphosphorylase / glucosamine-1-phosphate N-acetyltransferase / galactosamine-1-phosphate N-acetyltransferase
MAACILNKTIFFKNSEAFMQAVLMVAGKSTRTYPLTLTRPKPLLPILNRPLIEHSLDQLYGLFDEVILIVGYRQEMIHEALGDSYRGMRLLYQEQREQKGTGHAVLQAQPHIKGRFVAMNGDDLFAHQDLARLLQYPYAALAKEVPDPSQYGVCMVDKDNHLLNMVEKPKEFLGNLANIGCYIFEPEIFSELEHAPLSIRGEIEIMDGFLPIARRQPFKILPITGFWLPTGYAWDLLAHQEFLMRDMTGSDIKGVVEPGATLHGPVQVGKNTVIKAGSYIEGPVIIGEGCTIGPNCYIRGCTAIGNQVRVGQGVEIKNSIIMSHSYICHLSYVGDSVVGKDCNLGAGTITANFRHDAGSIRSAIKGKLVDSGRKKFGAILSDGVHTGIHTSIYPGRKLWPATCTLPGARVDRDISPAEWTWS